MGIVVTNLTKEYQRGGRVFKAVDSVSLNLPPGEFISVVGKSGSGKSTLLNMIAGLTVPTSGNVRFHGEEIFSLEDADVSAYRNEKIGYIPQGQSLLSKLTVLDNVRLPFHMAKRDGNGTEKAMGLLEAVGISHLADSYPKRLSGGEIKRAAIARALINSPEVLLADEPTGDLDTQTTGEVMSLLRAAARNGTAVLMVTHEPDVIHYGDKCYEMQTGVLSEKLNHTGDVLS